MGAPLSHLTLSQWDRLRQAPVRLRAPHGAGFGRIGGGLRS